MVNLSKNSTVTQVISRKPNELETREKQSATTNKRRQETNPASWMNQQSCFSPSQDLQSSEAKSSDEHRICCSCCGCRSAPELLESLRASGMDGDPNEPCPWCECKKSHSIQDSMRLSDTSSDRACCTCCCSSPFPDRGQQAIDWNPQISSN